MSTAKKSAIILDGKALAEKIKLDLAKKISRQKTKPGLAVVLVGNDPASALYVRLKEKTAQEVGINFHKYLYDHNGHNNISGKKLLELIKFLNNDREVNGIIVQLPLPKKYQQQKIIDAIDPAKDVDGFHPKNQTGLVPPTIGAILELLKATREKLTDKSALIIGKSEIFLEGLKKHLRQLGINQVGLTRQLIGGTRDYDIIIIALGRAQALKKSMVKAGAIVIDVGINKVRGKTVGDVDEKVAEVASFLSPVPGGVGPLTVACLLKNVYLLSQKNKQ